ncbi:interferon alpha-inducible protein 27-like protein 1 [Labrus mixtus]|uniref:interferon alpha-inducible protein 27-like protein 1 n=1 Tax=Labrus mixtus TaxID=508554 RepID=UPI0029C0B4CC|nr:interferon alpha-inducible protein 27-like protein 1 [Labrus mixtus]
MYDVREELCKGVVIGAGGVVTVIFTPVLLGLLGFTKIGIAAGSIAAKIMAWLGVVPSGSLFAFLQSIGATGLTLTLAGYVASFGGTMGWMLSAICNQNNTTST